MKKSEHPRYRTGRPLMRATGALREQVSAASLSRCIVFLGTLARCCRRSPSPRAPHTRAPCVARVASSFWASARGGSSPRPSRLWARAVSRSASRSRPTASRRRLRRASRVRAAARRGRGARLPPGFEETLAHVAGFLRTRARGGSRGRREHGGVHVRHRDASARPDVAGVVQRGSWARRRSPRSARAAALVPVLVFGSAVTKIKLEQKRREGIAEARGGRRGRVRVGKRRRRRRLRARSGLPSDDVPAGLRRVFRSKLSDTTASEVGKAYETTYLSRRRSRAPRGAGGCVVSRNARGRRRQSVLRRRPAALVADVRGAAVCVSRRSCHPRVVAARPRRARRGSSGSQRCRNGADRRRRRHRGGRRKRRPR